jgi:A/G-specific adenine glycosylase
MQPTGKRDRISCRTHWPRLLLAWYRAHRRAMPWRGHPDSYAVWISEIMLQQTQVDTVRPYFDRFLARFPDVVSLAAAGIDDVLKLWEGLGYYRRARNLHQAAKIVAARPDGNLPRTAAELARLPGIGAYTSAAIASICHGEPIPVVDGNVIRVGARFLGWSDDFRDPRARERLAAWLEPFIRRADSAGDFNQALMELGALVCKPVCPVCGACPLRRNCHARHTGRQAKLPVKPARKAAVIRHVAAVRIRDQRGRMLLVRRPDQGLLAGLWELPGGEVDGRPAPAVVANLILTQTGLRIDTPQPVGELRHAFTHFRQQIHLFDAHRAGGRLRAGLRGTVAWCAEPATLTLTTACRTALGWQATGVRQLSARNSGRRSLNRRKQRPLRKMGVGQAVYHQELRKAGRIWRLS